MSAPFDPTRIAHLTGRFAPVTDEVDEVELAVTGELPSDLDGVYLRNGPNPRFSPIGSYLFPIDGDGMLHGIWISDGKARYRNRFVRTPALQAEERVGRALWGGIESMITPGPEDVGPDLAHTFKSLPDINVVRHAGRLLALAESDCPFRMTPDLETLGKETFGGQLPAGITAHPKIDPVTGEMAVFCYALEPPYLTWSLISRTGRVSRGPVPVTGADEPMMIHDMALTSRYLVLVLAPAFFDITAAMSGGSFIAWRPERGTRVALIPRHGGQVRWADDDAFWLWHTVNAYDTAPDGDVVLEFVQWPQLTLGQAPAQDRESHSGLTKAVIDPTAGTMRRTQLDDAHIEFPRIDDRLIGRRHRQVAVACDSGRTGKLLSGEYDSLRWYNTQETAATSQLWHAGDLSVGEPAFAPTPGTTGSEFGHWMTFATDRTDQTSWLLIIPAQEPEAGPIARIRIPVRVPLGLHGTWLPTQE